MQCLQPIKRIATFKGSGVFIIIITAAVVAGCLGLGGIVEEPTRLFLLFRHRLALRLRTKQGDEVLVHSWGLSQLPGNLLGMPVRSFLLFGRCGRCRGSGLGRLLLLLLLVAALVALARALLLLERLPM